MNMKLITTLAVAIALISALTFVDLYKKHNAAQPAEKTNTVSSTMQVQTPVASAPAPSGPQGVKASVIIGNPNGVTATVKIAK